MKKIVVVMGGPSTEAEVSRRSGKAILHALLEKGYQAEALELDPPNFPQQIKASGADFVFNALHGKYGEDGIIQGTLDMMGIPYTSSGVMAAAVTMDKVATKRFLWLRGFQLLELTPISVLNTASGIWLRRLLRNLVYQW